MYNFAQRRKLYFLFSAMIIIPGLFAMGYSIAKYNSPVRLSIDFTGGTLLEIPFVNDVDEQAVRDSLSAYGLDDYVVQRLDPEGIVGNPADSRWEITIPTLPEEMTINDVVSALPASLGDYWSPDTSADDPDRTAAVGITTLDDGTYQLDVSFANTITEDQLKNALTELGIEPTLTSVAIQPGSRWQIRLKELNPDAEAALRQFLQEPDQLGPIWSPNPNNIDSALLSSSVSATVGNEVTRSAVIATMAVAIIVMGFIILAFRNVPNSFRYGACAIIAMFHDILVTMGIMSMLGIFLGWEADALFLTAILTVVGYSVQDSIVVFDRIRENTPKYRGEDYEIIVNRSVLETVHRSLATQINAVFVLFAILLFGGETIRHFIAIMLIGLMSGTYSSIFNAVPLLVAWEQGEIPFINREAKRKRKNAAQQLPDTP